ncbi:hypothetical protein H1C71_009278 [Ictidomys tridecemlineatus]|nr:hypothetical protein H1C71_009278 [Ictidomys tridecemlineatus]
MKISLKFLSLTNALSVISLWGLSTTTMTSILISDDSYICNFNPGILLEILPLNFNFLLDISLQVSHKLGQCCTISHGTIHIRMKWGVQCGSLAKYFKFDRFREECRSTGMPYPISFLSK